MIPSPQSLTAPSHNNQDHKYSRKSEMEGWKGRGEEKGTAVFRRHQLPSPRFISGERGKGVTNERRIWRSSRGGEMAQTWGGKKRKKGKERARLSSNLSTIISGGANMAHRREGEGRGREKRESERTAGI